MRYARLSLSALLTLALFASLGSATSPSLGSITPRGGQRGASNVILFNGARLADAVEILSFAPGFAVEKLEVVNDNQVKATVKIAPDCRLGEHVFRVRTKTGVSEMRTYWVGNLPAVDEVEPNNDFDKPQPIALNVTVTGVVASEDVDYFVVECKKGQRLSAEIEGMRLANTLFDPYIAILDTKRFELAATDDSPLLGQDAMVSVVVPADGKYIVQVRESAYGGNGACAYRLHVGTFPRPLAVVPAGGKYGEEIELTFLGDPAGPFKQKVKLPAGPVERFGVVMQDVGGVAPSAIPFRLAEFGNAIEVDGNTTHATATPFELPNAVNGVIAKPGEVDHFRFKGKKGQTYDVHCYARRVGSPLDSVMTISNFNGGALVANDDSGGPDSYFRFTVPDDKEYVLTITDHLGKGGPTYFYRVEFTAVQPEAVIGIPKVALYSQERQTIAVPRGNRYATLIQVGRRDFGGELILGADKLPAGVTWNSENMPANLDTIPVVFEATAAATPGGLLTPLNAKHADPKQAPLGSRFYQMAELIISAPGQSLYWRAEATQAAIAVTEEVPFKISIVEPKVPLVQNGSMNLKVVVERKPGFTAPITILPLWNPPGVSSASSATIAEGATETILPLNASGGAQVRKWKTAVVGVATVGNGPVYVSSQLAVLEVAAPFFTFALERAAAEQGKDTEIFCKIQQLTAFPGNAKVRLLGLPNTATAGEMEITKDTKELAFKVTVPKTTPAGQHRNLLCQTAFVLNGEPVVYNVGGGELRVDVPIVPKVAPVPTPMPTPVAVKPPDPAKPPEKRLTRLEKLRLEQEEREKAAKGGTPAPEPKK